MSQLQDLQIPNIDKIQLKVDPAGKLAIGGTIATRDPAASIAPFFRVVHQAIVGDALKEFTVDLTELRFVNSSAIRLFVDWVTWDKKEPPENRYKFIIEMDQKVTWQKTSLGVLRTLAPEVVELKSRN